ncbi:hypothetical protein CVIRNUC_010056 [Coccomyxa viridis]|uniref:Uncharacterized protein n=1 Tax=Coccomyxa viridis TaxID=1274662 RepID=A0AAV1IHW7_9CHLO|nr:hypothetical protein CVIRNUC_010056 [Coccomyxa viridis]
MSDDIAESGPISLLDICTHRVARLLLENTLPQSQVQELPGPDIACKVSEAIERLARLYQFPHFRSQGQHFREPHLQILTCFAPFWPLHYVSLSQVDLLHADLQPLQVLRPQLVHLELASYHETLSWCTGFTALTCLSLRGCSWLQPQGLGMLRGLLSLRALDLSEQYDAVSDEAGPILASLPSLEALNLALTNVGDLLIDALTYSRRLAAWARETSTVLSAEQARWPLSRLKHLGLHKTHVTGECLPHLEHLEGLRFLDARGTAVQRRQLIRLEVRFGLHALRGAVLATSNTAAAPYLVHGQCVCACGTVPDSKDPLYAWGKRSMVRLLKGHRVHGPDMSAQHGMAHAFPPLAPWSAAQHAHSHGQHWRGNQARGTR